MRCMITANRRARATIAFLIPRRLAICSPPGLKPPDDQQRFDQHSQVWRVLDQLLDAGLELHRPDHSDLETEVTI